MCAWPKGRSRRKYNLSHPEGSNSGLRNGINTTAFTTHTEEKVLTFDIIIRQRKPQQLPPEIIVKPATPPIVGRDFQLETTRKESNRRSTSLSRFYHDICFSNHKRECIICGEQDALDVHHFDGNRENNAAENLIPLCANHHRLVHMLEHKDKIQEQIHNYINQWRKQPPPIAEIDYFESPLPLRKPTIPGNEDIL
jgi:hypothetical protein